MTYFERDILDQSKIVEITTKDGGGPTVRLQPADAPSVMLGDGRDDASGSGAAGNFSWRLTVIVTAAVLVAFLAAAFL